MFGERCGDADPKTFRDLMIEGYLLGTDFVSPLWVMKQGGKWKPQDLEQTGVVQDEHGANQLEGELKRFWAYKSGMQPADVKVGAGILGTFCDESGLHADVYKAFGKKLNLF